MKHTGFTLIELMVVIAIIATLLTLAVPRYFGSVERSKEAVLRENLALTRDAIQKFYADRGRYPESLEELSALRYLRKVPVDPFTASSSSWVVTPPDDPLQGGVYDLHSAAPGNASNATPYSQW